MEEDGHHHTTGDVALWWANGDDHHMSAPEPPYEELGSPGGIKALTLPDAVTAKLDRMVRAGTDAPHVVFVGPAASGKTTAARALAGEVGAPLGRVDLAQVASAYIGETEKNLRRLLAAAEDQGAVLLFDEADALFGASSVVDATSRQRVMELLVAHPGGVIIESRHHIELPLRGRDRFAVVEFPPRGDTRTDPPIEGIDSGRTAFVGAAAQGPFDEPRAIAGTHDFATTFGTPTAVHPMGYAVSQFFDNGGTNAVVVRVPARSGDPDGPIAVSDLIDPPLEASNLGIWAVRDAGGFGLLCIPPLGPGHDVDPLTRIAALALCLEQRAFLILDPPFDWYSSSVVDPADLFPSGVDLSMVRSLAAVYWPHIVAPDPGNADLPGLFAPSGAVAGVYARTDRERGVWKAPAGTAATLSVIGIEPTVSDADSARLNPIGVNALRTLPGMGTVVWGARTLDGADAAGSEWKYVPVRRTALYLERSLAEGLRWTVFEPNGEALWQRITVAAENFLFGLYRQGGLLGAKPSEAFFVRCDRTTTTQADIDRGIVNLLVGYASFVPAEFMVVTIPLSAEGPV